MNENIFREYDIRGIVGSELDLDKSYELGRAIATYLKTQHPAMERIIVGRDGRAHSIPLADGVTRGILDSGINVVDIGLSPTPVLYFAIHHLNNPFGLTITASHNPKEYNGVKIWGVSGERVMAIRDIFFQKQFMPLARRGQYSHYDANTAYLDYLTQHFNHLQGANVSAVIDCGNGSAGMVIPELIERLNLKGVKLLYADVDGLFPHHEADPTVEHNMLDVRQALRETSELKLGLGFDGDADRMNPMTKEGVLVPGDQLLALYAQTIIEKHPGRAVVFDIKSSGGLIELLEQWRAQPILSPSGHSNIKHRIKQHNAVLGGELSCHFFFNDRYFGFDDGIYAALRLFEMTLTSNKSLSQMLSVFPHKVSSKEFRLACSSDAAKKVIIDHVKQVFAARTDVQSSYIDGIRAQMPYGWGLARASNTQPVICLRFESSNQAGLTQVKQDFYEALAPHFDSHELRKHIEFT